MRNFQRGYKNDSGSNFSRGDRRNDRDNRYQTNDTYKRPADKGFNRSFSDRSTKPRRDYDNELPNRNSYNQERRDIGNRYTGRPFQERGFRNEKTDRYRNQTPPRSRDREGHPDTRFNRPNDARIRPRPASPSSFRNRNDFQSTSVRPARGGAVRRTIGSAGPPRILRRNDLRSSLISKRAAPINRSKEYIKKIKQARLKLSEVGKAKTIEEPKTPPRESKKEHDDEDDFLDVANDVIFEEDVEALGKPASAKTEDNGHTSKEHVKSEDKNESLENLNTSGASEERNRKDREKSGSRENDTRSSSIDLNCVHCLTKCSSILDFRNHLTRRIHMTAMKKVSIKVRMTLNRLRKVQRDRQLEIEARLKNVEKIPSKYCQICKLYFRQSKIEHRDSEDHKKIRNFLKPYCKLCHVQLLSAMKYEIHKCTINHLKMKGSKNEAAEDVDFQELDLGDFKTVDSIGDVDGEEEESDDEEDFDSKDTLAVGLEFVNKVEVNYCSLCRDYIPLLRTSKDEKVVADHCKSKKHLKWYFQSKKKDETELNVLKAKSGNDPMEEDAAQDVSRKSALSEKSNESTVTTVARDKDDNSEESPRKFKRYYEVTDKADNDD